MDIRRERELQAVRNALCKSGNKCITCGFKVRGPNHATGDHHKRTQPKK